MKKKIVSYVNNRFPHDSMPLVIYRELILSQMVLVSIRMHSKDLISIAEGLN